MSVEGHVDFVKMRILMYNNVFPLNYIMSYYYKAMKGYISLLIKGGVTVFVVFLHLM